MAVEAHFSLNRASFRYVIEQVTFLKSITVLLVAAIASPMCCCVTLAQADLETVTDYATDAHKCCTVTDVPSEPDSAQPDGNHDCLHEELKVSQHVDSASSVLSAASNGGLLLAPFQSETLFARSPQSLRFDSTRDARAIRSGPTYSQQYCVYLL